MWSRLMIPAVLQLALPLVLLAWQARGRDTHLVSWSLKHMAVWSYIYATTIAGLWLLLPWYMPHVLMVISIALAARTLPGAFTIWRAPRSASEGLGLAARVAVAILCGITLWLAIDGRRPPAAVRTVALTFPLRSGQYHIVNGGSTALVNAHVRMLTSDRFRRYRGSSYGIDIVGLNLLGTRASGPGPRDPAQYAIFGDTIYAPCEGVVIRSEDGLPDLAPPEVDRTHLAGNFVMLECGDMGEFHVLLGHMQSGSVQVHPGDYVTLETPLGAVGNSGNSDEPHLHVHAQRPGRIWDLFVGDPLPVRFDGRYLVRNDRIISTAGSGIIDD
jgi:hypothetical protein